MIRFVAPLLAAVLSTTAYGAVTPSCVDPCSDNVVEDNCLKYGDGSVCSWDGSACSTVGGYDCEAAQKKAEDCDVEERICLDPLIYLIDAEDSVPLPDNTVTIVSSNTETVTFSVSQTWGTDGDIGWVAPAYDQGYLSMVCNPADVIDFSAPVQSAQYTAKCTKGSASIEFYVSNGYADLSPTNKRNCENWGDGSGIASYTLELSCNGKAVCGDDVEDEDDEDDEEETEEQLSSLEHKCTFPKDTGKYSIMTRGDAEVSANNIYSAVSVGGTFGNPSGKEIFIGTHYKYVSKMQRIVGKCFMTFGDKNGRLVGPKVTKKKTWKHMEWLAQTVESSTIGKYVVVVKTEGGEFTIDDICSDCEQTGKNLLVVFNTNEKVVLKGNGKPFTASVVAPFSRVELDSSAIYLDGNVVADTFYTVGENPNTLQIKGNHYRGKFDCGPTAPPTQSPTKSETLEKICLSDTMLLVNDEDKHPLKDGSLVIDSYDANNTLTFTIRQTYNKSGKKQIDWLNMAYDQDGKEMYCNPADRLSKWKYNQTATYTATCNAEGKATVELFIAHQTFKKAKQHNLRECEQWKDNDFKIAMYAFELSCDGRQICVDDSPTEIPEEVKEEEVEEKNERDEFCSYPSGTSQYAVITRGNADISANTVWRAVVVGGTLENTAGTEVNVATVNKKKSFVHHMMDKCYIEFKGTRDLGINVDNVIDFSRFEWLARNLFESSVGKNNVIIMQSGGTFNLDTICSGCEENGDCAANCNGQDSGENLLLVFNTTEDVTLTGVGNGIPFMGSVIAPFSKVLLDSEAGLIDGFVVADTFYTVGENPSSLIIRGKRYKGPLVCSTDAPTSGPSAGPTDAPTSGPSAGPTSMPTTSSYFGTTTSKIGSEKAGSNGDPHFRTWRNEHFEYHGQCDMILTKDDDFADGLGLEVHIRTKLVRFWSYIRSAAIRIGDDILEIEGSATFEGSPTNYWINLQYNGELSTVGGFPVTFNHRSTSKRIFTIDLSSKYPGQKIKISTYKEFIRVDFEHGTDEAFGNAVGLLGNFKTGETLARDGKTVIEDFSAYGNEWQVLPVDNMLFHDVAQPQFPKKCIEPEDPRGERRRRLGETEISEEEAAAACSHLKDEIDRKDCIYDVLATQDIDMVGAF